ncbi:hypothetical protein JOC95_001121 [Bacillus tianshenii]|uniref:Uncharacterized protein n=1 Tax=Sutcliffiella tianshenii TaxID=1463404 RepID=A0ABS2NX77_9BACI|nr:hypothetical protein [Bacillus tianshenii]MBM7619272.1 hypothetical protein [Bacillus tianshenii]
MTDEEQLHPKPKLYVDHIMSESNQSVLRKNYLMELLNKQAQTNDTLSHSVFYVQEKLEETNAHQLHQFDNILTKMGIQEEASELLKKEIHLNDRNTKEVIDRLKALESMSGEVSRTLEEERLMSQATIDQLSYQEDLTRKIHNQLNDYEMLYKDIQQKMKDQESLYEQINRQLEIQDMFHQTVIQRMDQQDANTKQIENKMDTLRQTMIDKIDAAVLYFETKYKQTLYYLGNLFNTKGKRIIPRKLPQQKDESIEMTEKEKVSVD